MKKCFTTQKGVIVSMSFQMFVAIQLDSFSAVTGRKKTFSPIEFVTGSFMGNVVLILRKTRILTPMVGDRSFHFLYGNQP